MKLPNKVDIAEEKAEKVKSLRKSLGLTKEDYLFKQGSTEFEEIQTKLDLSEATQYTIFHKMIVDK